MRGEIAAVQGCRPPRHGLAAQNHLQASSRIEFHHHVAFDVDGPDGAVGVHAYSVRRDERVLAPGLQHLAILVELNDRVRTAIEYPDVVFAVNRHARAFTEVPAFRKLRPILDDFVGQRRSGFELGRSRRAKRERGQRDAQQKPLLHCVPPSG